MNQRDFTVWESSKKSVYLHDGQPLSLPDGWIFVPSGDPGLTRRLKASGTHWTQVHLRRHRIEAVGVWLPAKTAERVKAELEAERADPAYRKKLEASRHLRERRQADYEREFRSAVLQFLAFHKKWASLAENLADAVTAHAVPVGSGTVARTVRIPLSQRAEAAVIAWMRHRTTAYDNMTIPRIRGNRREVRRHLAEGSRRLLEQYRAGLEVDTRSCPLWKAIHG